MQAYPKRLIEVDLPIKRISAHARREKSIRHGHISTLHIWWARRPLAACRAVICASLWPDPADPQCPQSFRNIVRSTMLGWTTYERQMLLSEESRVRFDSARKLPSHFDNPVELRGALLDFIADFANWDNCTKQEYLDTCHTLTQGAHDALGGVPDTHPLVVDPFAGGGSIPLEALRVGADAFASDLNPIPILLNKVVLEYIPRYGQRLSDEIHRIGGLVKSIAEKELGEYYPADPDGASPIAYIWARTVRCEGPGCGTEIPIITQPVLAEHKETRIALICVPNCAAKSVFVDVREMGKSEPTIQGTVKRSSVTCPVCGYTTPASNVRKQFSGRKGGILDARLLAVVTITSARKKSYRVPTDTDTALIEKAKLQLVKTAIRNLPAIPSEPLPYLRSIFNIHLLDVTEWGQLFTPRQALLLATFARIISERGELSLSVPLEAAAVTCLGLALDKMADFHTSLARWIFQGEKIGNTFGRQALGIIWDYAEANPFGNISGSWDRCIEYIVEVIENNYCLSGSGSVHQASATMHPLPTDSAAAFFTDPPYYDAVPYADLSDFFYVWLKRSVGNLHSELFVEPTSPKEMEVVQLAERNKLYAYKTRENFERRMAEALAEGRRIIVASGIGVIVFAHKATQAWETMLQAVMDSGWIVVASWPIDTERQGRLRAMDSAALASSVHLVCRPRESTGGSVRIADIGDWRDVLLELPRRIHEWMPRLANEGVVGADAIFACLGPALEIFSRYSRVEKASGETVALKEYLEQVWAAVAKEALSMVFRDADTTGLEPDSRLTAMWLWTLNAGSINGNDDGEMDDSDEDSDDGAQSGKTKATGFVLEYDAARKIAQGLGAHLEDLGNLVEVSGEKARLLPVEERARYLFGKNQGHVAPAKKKKVQQPDLFNVLEGLDGIEATVGEPVVERQGKTVLDRIHQSMILFAAGRGEALKRFLVEDGVGRDPRFWSLAQALSALYPTSTSEKRWVDGVLARKKGLGF